MKKKFDCWVILFKNEYYDWWIVKVIEIPGKRGLIAEKYKSAKEWVKETLSVCDYSAPPPKVKIKRGCVLLKESKR